MRDFLIVLPEVFLALTAVAVIASEVGYHGERLRVIAATAILGLCGAFVQTLLTFRIAPTQAFASVLSIDPFALFFKLLFILLAILAVLGVSQSDEISPRRRAEYYALITGSTLAMSLLAGSAHLMVAFLCLQLVNVLGFFLAAFDKSSSRSTEAAVKHLVFGAVAGAILLFGAAILFAHTHSLNIYEIHWALMDNPLPRESALAAFVLIVMSLGFQVGAFPMHQWAPDVLQGAPTPVSAFLTIGARAAGFALLLRLSFVLFAQPALSPGGWQVLGSVDWPRMIALIAGITMTIGGLMALRQTSTKRLLAYLVIAETGLLLMGLLVLDQVGVSALLYNLGIQLFAWMGAFYVLGFFYDQLKSDELSSLKGMLSRAAPECVFLILCLICIVGLPPFPGFFGKFALIGAAIRHEWTVIAVLAIFSGALSTVAITRLAFSLVGDFVQSKGSAQTAIPILKTRRLYLAALITPILVGGLLSEFFLRWVGNAAHFILW